MAGRGLVAVSAEHLQEMQQEMELQAAAADPRAAREVLSLPALRQRLGRGRDLLRAVDDDDELLPTALPAVDPLLAGGIARGCLTELRGAPSTGRFGLVVALLAATTARGEAAALVDLGDQLDPQEAARCGVVLPRLLWARPRRLREALAAAEITLGGDFPLVVLELGVPPLPYGAGDEHAWLRLARAARLHRSALLVSTPWRVSGTAAGEVLALSRRGGVWIGSGAGAAAARGGARLLAGVAARLVREKSRRQPEQGAAGSPRHAELRLRAPSLLGPLPAPGRAPATRLLPAAPPRRQPAAEPAVAARGGAWPPPAAPWLQPPPAPHSPIAGNARPFASQL